MKKLNLEQIRNELGALRKNNLKNDFSEIRNAEYLNEILSILGCDRHLVRNSLFPGHNDGSDLFVALVYSNLILAERIAIIEKAIDFNKENKDKDDFIIIKNRKILGNIDGQTMTVFDRRYIPLILSMRDKGELWAATFNDEVIVGMFNHTLDNLNKENFEGCLKIGFR